MREIFKNQRIRYTSVIAGCIFLALLSSCANEENVRSVSNSGVSLPQLVQRMTIPSGGQLSATVTIDKGTADEKTRDMKVDAANNRLNFSGKVEPGTHTFLIEVFYSSPTVDKIRLVTASRTVNVASDQTISFNDGEYVYDDLDNDNFTNVVEIETGSDPFQVSSIPDEAVADDNYEPNNSYSTAYDITSLRGAFFNTKIETNTGAGQLTLSDNIDLFKITIDATRTSSFEIETNTDYGVYWVIQNYLDNGAVNVPVELIVDEDTGNFIHRKAVVSNLQSLDYYVFFFTPDDAIVPGTYSFGWD